MRALPRHGRSPPRQRGVALLAAILIVALGTMIAAAVAYENAMTARRGVATYAFDQSVLIAEGAEALAAYGLRQIVQSDPKEVYLGQGWDKPYGPLEVVPGVMLEAQLEDLQGRFNLNNLVQQNGTPDPVMTAAFTKLLTLVGLEEKWTGYIVDWIDMDGTPSIPEGAEDSVYMGQTVPYRTPNRYITSASELLALPGFGRDRYLKLAPYVTALPWGTKVNICTAQGVVLDAFSAPGHTEFSNDPEGLTKSRQGPGAASASATAPGAATSTGCYPTLQNYQATFDPKTWAGTGTATTQAGQIQPQGMITTPGVSPIGRTGSRGVQSYVGTTSNYFRLTSIVSIGSTEFDVYSLLFQDSQQQMVRPIQRSFTPD